MLIMKIAVISANGRSGKVFVEEAIAAGHKVRAGVYGIHNFVADENLEIIECDATCLADVKKLIKDQDAVVSLIGHTKRTPVDVQSNAIRNVINLCEGKSTRIVSLTGTGVRFSGDRPSMIDKILNFSIRYIDPNRIKDGINHVELLKQSKTNWTVVRVLKLGNGSASKFNLTSGGPAKLLTSRREVAKAILQVLSDQEYAKTAPVISK